jgi:AbrB family looped-hinge helix DNA binding protein
MPKNLLDVEDEGTIVIPKQVVKKLGIEPGDQVHVNLISEAAELVLKPADGTSDKGTARVARLTAQFIERYRDALRQIV